jgi:hypothetical protein
VKATLRRIAARFAPAQEFSWVESLAAVREIEWRIQQPQLTGQYKPEIGCPTYAVIA